MSEDRKRAMRDGFEKLHGVSMGCQVPESPCSACWDEDYRKELTTKEVESMRRKYLGPQYEISWVPSPKCESCGDPMEPASSTEWSCCNEYCDRRDIPTHTGIYPFLPIKDS